MRETLTFADLKVDYRTHSNKGRILYKVGTAHDIKNDLFNVFFFETLIE